MFRTMADGIMWEMVIGSINQEFFTFRYVLPMSSD
jgi:hypothetical protein